MKFAHNIKIMKKIKVILSTFGPLHLIKSAEYLCPFVDIKVIQGWIPAWWNKWLLKPISSIIGYDLSRTIKKRTPACLEDRNVGIGLPEFFCNVVHYITRNPKRQTAWIVKSYHMYGKQSRKYIQNADVFHVRSGSGRGGAIESAKRAGMKILVDHSIAHPVYMEQILKDEYKRNDTYFDMGISNSFWREIVDDCDAADILLVNSSFVRDTFIATGYNPEKIRIAYLGVRKDFFFFEEQL